jgi:hypothetical protein
MLRDGRLRQIKSIDDLTANALVVAREQPEDLDARRVPERLGKLRQLIVGRAPLDGA